MSCSSVLRIGPSDNDNPSVDLLRNALIEHLGKGETQNNNNNKSCTTFTISNRYFSAEILLANQSYETTNNNATTPGIEFKEDGIVLVFDDVSMGGQTTFDSLALAHQHAESNDQCGDLLRLCVGVSVGPKKTAPPSDSKKAEEEYSKRVLWCLDRGYEYVEVDLSEEGKSTGHDERDKDGFARVVEAIGGTVWSSAVMSRKKSNQLRGTYEQAERALAGSGGEKKDDSTTPATVREKAASPPPQPTSVSSGSEANDAKEEKKSIKSTEGKEADISGATTTTDSDPRAEAASASLLLPKSDSENKPAISAQKALGKVNANHDANEEKRRAEMEQEEFFDDLECAMKEASRIREASKQGSMSDDTRRQVAGDAALRIMDLMNKMDFMDDEDYEGEHSSDEENIS